MTWFDQFNGAFWISLATLIMGGIGLGVKACLSSKCSETNICFGCLKITRDIGAEEDIELATINRASIPITPGNAI